MRLDLHRHSVMLGDVTGLAFAQIVARAQWRTVLGALFGVCVSALGAWLGLHRLLFGGVERSLHGAIGFEAIPLGLIIYVLLCALALAHIGRLIWVEILYNDFDALRTQCWSRARLWQPVRLFVRPELRHLAPSEARGPICRVKYGFNLSNLQVGLVVFVGLLAFLGVAG